MNAERDPSRIVSAWLKEETGEDADRILDLVLAKVETLPQRRASWLARRFPPMNNTTVRFGIAAAAAVFVALLGINLVPGLNSGSPEPTPTATPRPLTDPSLLTSWRGKELPAGTYQFDDPFPVRGSFTVPAGWEVFGIDSTLAGICRQGSCDPPQAGFGIWIVNSVPQYPCGIAGSPSPAPSVGPTVADLAEGLAARPGYEITGPTNVTVDGYRGQQIMLVGGLCPNGSPSLTWGSGQWTRESLDGETAKAAILDVDGVRLVIDQMYFPSTSQDVRDEVQAIMDSVTIEGLSTPPS